MNLDDIIKNELINIMKDDSFHEQFILIMSHHRMASQRKKAWIDIMGECINIIIEKCKENNCYDKIKDCIILSQTYYYIEEENEKKIFMFEAIKNNRLFQNINFWQNFINLIIEKEYKDFLKTNNINYVDSSDGLEINQRLKNKLSYIIFSQLLPYIKNMIDFDIDKENLIKIIEFFKEKYKYHNAFLSYLLT
jgi:hypothetical protein